MSIILWSIESKSMIHKYTHHSDSVWGVLSVGDFIFSASADSRIGIAKISTKSFDSFITLKPCFLNSLNFKQNLLAYGSGEKVLIWDMNNPKNETIIGSHTYQVYATCISLRQEFLISGSCGTRNNLIMWDLKTKSIRSELIGHNNGVFCVDISADDLNAISGDGSGKVLYWDLTNFRQEFEFEGHTEPVQSVKFARNKKFAASGGYDMKVLVWDIESKILYATFSGHANFIFKVAITNDNENVVSGDYLDGIRVWNIASKKQIFLFKDLNESKEWLGDNKGIEAEFIRFLI